MKYIATVALMLNLGIVSVCAHERPAERRVRMTFSGTGGASAANLQQPGTSTGEDNLAGSGSLGAFTFRDIFAETLSPQPSATCSGPNQINFSRSGGAGVFRFQDGSLLLVNLTGGSDCVDFNVLEAHCTVTFQVTGGTGRFKGASGGTLTLTETVKPVLADAANNPVFFASVGEFTGNISGMTTEAKQHDEQE